MVRTIYSFFLTSPAAARTWPRRWTARQELNSDGNVVALTLQSLTRRN